MKEYVTYCWKCKKYGGVSYSESTKCLGCGRHICAFCGACSHGCKYTSKHDYPPYQNLLKEKSEKERQEKLRHEEWERQYNERERKKQINSFAGKTASAGIKLVTTIGSLGAATVGTAIRLVPFFINSESKTTKKIDDAIDKVCDGIEDKGSNLATKTGRAIDKMLGKDDY